MNDLERGMIAQLEEKVRCRHDVRRQLDSMRERNLEMELEWRKEHGKPE